MLDQTALTLPAADRVAPVLGGRGGLHSPHLAPLLHEMTEVVRMDPGAEW
jgi:ring-1,2-phenylacetyl-CoA epoxidase subunit PaaC